MLRAVAVDDEKKALERFERVIRQEENMTLIGGFTKAEEALDFIESREVDIVFLDIEMPQINGLELSERIFETKPEIDIVFVTAYDKYALQAFQAHAVGYLLKPIELEDIQNQVASMMKKKQARAQAKKSEKMSIECFGHFLCFPQGSENGSIHWRTAKAEELFAFLIHYQGKPVSKEKIIDTLWPEMDIDKASKNLHATCYYIRDTLNTKGYNDMFVRSRGSYQVKTDRLQCDMLEFIEILESSPADESQIQTLEKASLLYKGNYFDDKPYEWAMSKRIWFENEYEKLHLKLAEYYIKDEETGKAADTLNKLIYHNPLADEAYKSLIELSLIREDTTSAVMYYKRYEKILQDELDMSPSGHIRKLVEKLI